jgi:hypothetical protein
MDRPQKAPLKAAGGFHAAAAPAPKGSCRPPPTIQPPGQQSTIRIYAARYIPAVHGQLGMRMYVLVQRFKTGDQPIEILQDGLCRFRRVLAVILSRNTVNIC